MTPDSGLEPAWQPAFLAVLGTTGVVSDACAAARVSRQHAYRVRAACPGFAAAWDAALQDAADGLVREGRRRAVEGTRKLVLHKGEPVWIWLDPATGSVVPPGTPGAVGPVAYCEWAKSDALLMFLLRGARPGEYRDAAPPAADAGNPAAADPVSVYLPDNGRSPAGDGGIPEPAAAGGDGDGDGSA